MYNLLIGDDNYEGYVTQSVQKDLYASATLNLSTIILVPTVGN